jgi:putative glutamine amidotransferase
MTILAPNFVISLLLFFDYCNFINIKSTHLYQSAMKPLIGITSRYSSENNQYNLPDAYVKAIQRNGGTPIVIPPLHDVDYIQIYDITDGIIFSGGPDVDPLLYGEEPLPKQGRIEPMRDDFEFKLANLALTGKKPVFGICRGLQVLNIAAGGTLIQDIESQVEKPLKRRQDAKGWYGTHHVFLKQGSLIYEIFGKDKVVTNTFHHQACKDPAKGFKETGWTSDKVIEVLEISSEPWKLCVQWHPELMDNEDMNKLFKSFVESCK